MTLIALPLYLRSLRFRLSDVDAAARSPVLSALPRPQPLVDQVPAERRDVRMEPPEDPVHLALRVALAHVELECEPLQDHQTLRAPHRDLGQAAGPEVLPEDRRLLLVGGAQREARVPLG